MSQANAHKLEEVLIASYLEVRKDIGEVEDTVIDKQMFIDDVSWKTYKIIEQLSPFGEGNPKPVFLFKNIRIETVKHFGKEKNHLQIDFINSKNKKVSAIGCFLTTESFDKKIAEGESIDLTATIEKSTFRNFPELRLRIIDVV